MYCQLYGNKRCLECILIPDWLSRIFQEFSRQAFWHTKFSCSIFYRSALPQRCLRRTNVDKMVKMVTKGTIKKAKSMKNQVLQVCEEKDKCCEKMIRIPLPRMRRVGKPKPSMISSMLVSIVVTDKSFLHLLLRTFLLLPAFKIFCPPESLQFWILMSLMCHGCPVLNVCSAPGEELLVLAT